ncbi:MAG: PKD domain-containing protein [Patescibacteria group bacterium]
METYSWDFGDGTVPSSEPNPTHVFEKSGTFTVKLEAKYADQTVKSSEKDIVVKNAAE